MRIKYSKGGRFCGYKLRIKEKSYHLQNFIDFMLDKHQKMYYPDYNLIDYRGVEQLGSSSGS